MTAMPTAALELGWIEAIADQLLYSLALLIAAVGLLLLLLALLRDRAKGRARCPKCFYDLRQLAADHALPTCPECGRTPKRRRSLFKTRRRWRRAGLAAVVLLLAAATALTPRVREHGITTIVPTTVLLALVPGAGEEERADGSMHWAATELERRRAYSEMPPWQWAWYVRNKGVVETRKSWLEGEPVTVRLTAPAWCRPLRLIADAAEGSDQTLREAFRTTRLPIRTQMTLHHLASQHIERLPVVARRGDDVRFSLASFDGVIDRAVPISLPIRCKPEIDAVLQEVTSELPAEARSRIGLGGPQRRVVDGRVIEDWMLWAFTDATSAANGASPCLRATLLYNADVVATTLLDNFAPSRAGVWSTLTVEFAPGADDPSLAARVRDERLRVERGEQDGFMWRLRLQGDPIAALHDLDSEAYWSGSIEIPLAELLNSL